MGITQGWGEGFAAEDEDFGGGGDDIFAAEELEVEVTIEEVVREEVDAAAGAGLSELDSADADVLGVSKGLATTAAVTGGCIRGGSIRKVGVWGAAVFVEVAAGVGAG